MILAENETLHSLVNALSRLCEGTAAMSRYQYLAHLTEIATEVAQLKKVSADEVFRTLASVPRDKVPEVLKTMV
jgi:hypothetical protein